MIPNFKVCFDLIWLHLTQISENFPTCGINSYNFGRVLAQTVHYFWSYFKMTEGSEAVTFALPIGAMGNIAAGHLARICGLPIARFVGSVNINDITHRVFSKGEFHIEEEMFKNLSEAINIQAPYNFERVLYWSTGNLLTPKAMLGKRTVLELTYRLGR